MPAPTPDQLDPDWHKYPDTVLHFRPDPGVRVDLRVPVDRATLDALAHIGLAGPFGVLTAHDPLGRDEDARVNAERSATLDARLAALGASYVRVDACSPDGSHCEAGVAVAIARDDVTALAREFEQVAIFWFDSEKFWIIGALAGADPVMLPRPV